MSGSPLLPVRQLSASRFAVTSPAKLNLFLEVVRRRGDGYHEIESLLLAVDRGDFLVAEVLPRGATDTLRVERGRAPEDASNLVLVALALAREHRRVPPLALRLRKRIPPGAGLGGGSGDAAALLALLERIAPDPDGPRGVAEIAAKVGSDVPFFLGDSAAAVAHGRGELLSPFPGRLFGGDAPAFVIALPEIVSRTSAAYARISFPLTAPDGPITFPTRTFEDAEGWRRGLFNRLEVAVLASDPRLAELARRLREFARRRAGTSDGVCMTGSGSAFFLAGRDRADARRLEAELCSPNGPLASFAATTRIAVAAVRCHPHPAIERTP